MRQARGSTLLSAVCLLFASVLPLAAAEAKREYFTNVREVHVAGPQPIHFLFVDPEIWMHARTDLGDLRIYNGDREIPYALREQGSAEYTEQRPVKVLNKGIVPHAIQFLLDMQGVDVYDQVTLQITQHDFDRMVTVEGANSPNSSTWTQLTTAPIFDFTRHQLGSNLTIKLPLSNFRFLRVSISDKGMEHGNDILPDQIEGATAANSFRENAVWDTIAGTISREEKPHETIFHIELPKRVPLDRLHFVLSEDRVNFRRAVSVETRGEGAYKTGEEGWQPIATGSISRVQSAGGKVHEELDVSTHDTRAQHWRVVLQNGDDPPLPVEVIPQTLERRLYFDAHGATTLKLYYGDEKLSPPVYDFDKFFNEADAKDAVAATLGPGMHNPDYQPRPDERPWSERNGWVLWVAMLVAVIGIGAVALRGLKRV